MGQGNPHRQGAEKAKDRKGKELRTLAALDEIISPKPAIPPSTPAPRGPTARDFPPEPAAKEARDVRVMHSEKLQGGGKIFYFDYIVNERGPALRVTEISRGERTTLVVPHELAKGFAAMVTSTSAKLPSL